MKAIIEVAPFGAVFDAALADLAAGGNPNYILSFNSVETLFSDITPARLELINLLARIGCCSVIKLAQMTQRDEAIIHADVTRLIELGLIEQQDDTNIGVPFETLEIHMTLAHAA
ncbi:transcriptional regulator [Chromatium okenii]|uniref:Transcriptional regulator n=1 Tax=Chromatium okenii TaxID=61644 RepID=A0A2S7XTY3_9GAMM|nr:transcriptional regulator [Chromatium okenii]MBV5309494.1 transcriptional regulator [Chromatium okenii]PQJ96948.1 transcriptional regulator [Chromatium okenii]